MKITVKEANKGPQKVKAKFNEKLKATLSLIEALRNLPRVDFRKVIRITRQLRLADAIAIRAIGGVDE